jgi:hypothetical protein
MATKPAGDILSLWLQPPCAPGDITETAERLSSLTSEATNGRLNVSVPTSPVEAMSAGLSLSATPGMIWTDLSRCWYWLAAAMCHPGAPHMMMAAYVAEMQAPSPRLPMKELTANLAEWLRRSTVRQMPPKTRHLSVRDPETQDSPSADMVSGEDQSSGSDESVPASAANGHIVIRSIGDPVSRDGASIAARYRRIIGRPLPCTAEFTNPSDVARDFTEKFPWAANVATRLENDLYLLRSTGSAVMRLPEMLLVGTPGCGKTTMARWIAERCGFPLRIFPVGGTNDNGGLGAVARGWSTAAPCGPVLFMAETGYANPVLVLDEVDKGVTDVTNRNGSVIGTAISMLQKHGAYFDSCLMTEVDLSMVTWMATANSLAGLPAAIVDRFNIVHVPAPSPEHFDAILPGVIATCAASMKVQPEYMPWLSASDIGFLREVFSQRPCSVRRLERAYSTVAGLVAKEQMLAPH